VVPVSSEPTRDESGSTVGWLGSSTDIEDLKRAQEGLAASERDLRSIVDAIPRLRGLLVRTATATSQPALLDYAGMDAEQALGWGWGAAIHPPTATDSSSTGNRAGSGAPVDAEARMRRYDGAYRWFLFRANPLRDEAGNISKVVRHQRNIEDRKRVEEALLASELSWRQIVDNIRGLVATTGAAARSSSSTARSSSISAERRTI